MANKANLNKIPKTLGFTITEEDQGLVLAIQEKAKREGLFLSQILRRLLKAGLEDVTR